MGQGVHVFVACFGTKLVILLLIRHAHVVVGLTFEVIRIVCRFVFLLPQSCLCCVVIDEA